MFTTAPGLTSTIEHRIDTGNQGPVKFRLRPVNSKKREILDELLQSGRRRTKQELLAALNDRLADQARDSVARLFG